VYLCCVAVLVQVFIG